MNHHAEYVSPDIPTRLADAIADRIVTAAVRQKPDALVGVEVAVHTDCVFVDGRIAAGWQQVEIEQIVRNVYRAAGYGGSWSRARKIRVTTRRLSGKLLAEESISGHSMSQRSHCLIDTAVRSGISILS